MRSNIVRRTAGAACVALCATLIAAAAEVPLQPPLPTVLQIYPQGATAGETVQVEIVGNFLDQAESLRFDSDALEGSVVESSLTGARIRLASAPTAKSGLYSLRLLTRRGVSNLFHFRLTNWKAALEAEPNNRLDQAQPLPSPGVVSAKIAHFNDSDFYRITAAAGETLAFNLLMGRNGYATGGEIGHFTLTLMNSDGRVLAENLGRFLMDPYFQHTFETAGEYYLVVNHSRLAVTCLENECSDRWLWASYQLAIGRGPILWSMWPPAAHKGAEIEAVLRADFIDTSAPLAFSGHGVQGKIIAADGPEPGHFKIRIAVDETAEPGLRLLTVPDSSGLVFGLPFMVYAENLITEQEPNDAFSESPLIGPPLVILGRMDHFRDVDSFRFPSTGADSLTFQLTARNLGSEMSDPHLVLLCQEGDPVALTDDTPSFRNPRNRDAYMELRDTNRPCRDPEAGYFIQVRDWSTHSGDSRFYVLEVNRQEPSFELGLRPERIVLQRGRTNTVPVSLRRMGGFTGDVTVSVEGLPPGVELKSAVIGAGGSTGNLEFMVADSVPDGAHAVNLFGTAQVGEREEVSPAVLPQPMLGDGPGYVQTARQTAQVSIVPPVEFALERIAPPGGGFALDRHTLLLSGDRTARILLKVRRHADFSGQLDLGLEGLPEGVILEKKEWIDNGQGAELIVRVPGDRDVAAGEYRITAYASGNAGGRTLTEATPAFFLRVER